MTILLGYDRRYKISFLNQDADLSYKVALMDKEIDILYYKVREDCLKVMHENPEKNITQGVKLVFTARYLENRRSYYKYM